MGDVHLIEDSACQRCRGALAWRSGVGRVVITHAHGNDSCIKSPVATLPESQTAQAQAALDVWAASLPATPADRDGA